MTYNEDFGSFSTPKPFYDEEIERRMKALDVEKWKHNNLDENHNFENIPFDGSENMFCKGEVDPREVQDVSKNISHVNCDTPMPTIEQLVQSSKVRTRIPLIRKLSSQDSLPYDDLSSSNQSLLSNTLEPKIKTRKPKALDVQRLQNSTLPSRSKFQCDWCDKKFQVQIALNNHLIENCSKIPFDEKRKMLVNSVVTEKKRRQTALFPVMEEKASFRTKNK